MIDAAAAENERGGVVRPQVIARSVTVMTSLDAYHLFMLRPTYRKLATLPLAERVAAMRRPEVRAAILAEEDDRDAGGLSNGLVALFERALPLTFPLREPIDYEPEWATSVMATALAAGRPAVEHMYDLLLEDEGRAFYAVLGSNFVNGTLDVCREMLLSPHTVTGLSDAGAHVNLISDCSASTFHLTHWVRDRTRGEPLPLEFVVAKLTSGNARLYGFDDRGTLAPGKRADLNVIDLDNLRIRQPFMRADLPSGASRILQPSTGYQATMVNGVVTRRADADTGERPGRLLRGAA
jgi:N-acyl-D-aspartate/D-glutamate deacylase